MNFLLESVKTDHISNPFINSKLIFETDESENVEINIVNVSKYFKKVYIICPMKVTDIPIDIYKINIDIELLDNLKNKLALIETNTRFVKNQIHFNFQKLLLSEIHRLGFR